MNEIDVNQLVSQLRSMAAQASQTASLEPEPTRGAPDFATLLKQSVDKVNEFQQQASKLAVAFERGDPDTSLVSVMIAREKAGIAFETMTQVRNRLLRAYQDVMSMPM